MTIGLTEGGTLLIFLQSVVEKLHAWPGIKPTTLDLGSQSVAFDLSATATRMGNYMGLQDQVLGVFMKWLRHSPV